MMGKRRPNPRLAKIHRNYTVEEIASLYGVHKNTVRQWIKDGLPTSDHRRPLLVLGRDLAEFLHNKRRKNKRTCKPGESIASNAENRGHRRVTWRTTKL